MVHFKCIFSFPPQPLELEALLLLGMRAEIPFRNELGFSVKAISKMAVRATITFAFLG